MQTVNILQSDLQAMLIQAVKRGAAQDIKAALDKTKTTPAKTKG